MRRLTTEDASWNDQLGLDDDGDPDTKRVVTAADAVGAAIDAYLDAAQRDEPSLDPIGARWLNDVNPMAARKLRNRVTNGRNPVAAARYDLHVQLEPNPTLITARVRVERRDGTAVRVEMVFDVTSPKKPKLQLVASPKDDQ